MKKVSFVNEVGYRIKIWNFPRLVFKVQTLVMMSGLKTEDEKVNFCFVYKLLCDKCEFEKFDMKSIKAPRRVCTQMS